MKFGGTSTQDAAAIANVVQIVKSHLTQKPIIVISAIAQATNTLENAGRLASEGEPDKAIELIKALINRHIIIINERINNQQHNIALRQVFASALNELEELIRGVAILHELTPRSLDVFYSYGEILSSHIVTAALQEEGIEALWLDTKEFMITDDNYNRAQPMMEIVEKRLNMLALPLIQRGVVPVTQGYIGVTTSGRRTTMGRESSDYSAAVIGAALSVNDIQIWTDVDGVLTADPRVVQSPMKVNILSFEEAYELSFFGAKVLHPNTMLPAIEKNIPIHVYNSRHPSRSGTLVTNSHSSTDAVVKSIAYKRNIIVLTIKPRKRFSQYIFWEHLYSILTKYAVGANLTTTSEYSIAIAIDAKNNIEAVIHEIESLGILSIEENMGILCLVGSNLRNSPHFLRRLLTAMSDINIAMISFGASASSVSILIEDERVVEAVKNVHTEFFSPKPEGIIFESLDVAAAI